MMTRALDVEMHDSELRCKSTHARSHLKLTALRRSTADGLDMREKIIRV